MIVQYFQRGLSKLALKQVTLPFSALKMDSGLNGATLDTFLLEEEMRQFNGNVDFNSLMKDNWYDNAEMMNRFLPLRIGKRIPDTMNNEIFRLDDVFSVVNSFPEIGPCSMKVDSIEELAQHIFTAYVTSQFYYIYGKTNNIKGQFPNYCCGPSARSVMVSLMDLGYPNACCGYSKKDHFYGLMPFVLGEEKGTLVIEPTSDQMWKDGVRNKILVYLGSKWEHNTDWKYGADLFPDYIANFETIKTLAGLAQELEDTDFDFSSRGFYYFHKSPEEYFERAYGNPIKVTPKELVMLK